METGPLLALDTTNAHRIDQHIEGGQLVRQHLGVSHASSPRDRRRRRTTGRGFGQGIEHIHDATPPALFHARRHQAHQPDGREQLEIEIALPDLV